MSKRERLSWYIESPPKQTSFVFEHEEEDDVVILPKVDNSALLSCLLLSLVGRMFHQGGRSIEALVSLLPKEHIWDVEGRVRGESLLVTHGSSSFFNLKLISRRSLKSVLVILTSGLSLLKDGNLTHEPLFLIL